MVKVAVDGELRVVPEGLLKVKVKFSGPSAYESSMTRTLIVFDVSPGANVSVPSAGP
jgi:hypothetical protein